jgi:hypothetical protein
LIRRVEGHLGFNDAEVSEENKSEKGPVVGIAKGI